MSVFLNLYCCDCNQNWTYEGLEPPFTFVRCTDCALKRIGDVTLQYAHVVRKAKNEKKIPSDALGDGFWLCPVTDDIQVMLAKYEDELVQGLFERFASDDMFDWLTKENGPEKTVGVAK